jgi:hypothetical protein
MSYLRYLGLFAYSGQHTACLPYVASFSGFHFGRCGNRNGHHNMEIKMSRHTIE